MCIHIHTCTYIETYIPIHVHTCTHIQRQGHLYTHTHTDVHVSTNTHPPLPQTRTHPHAHHSQHRCRRAEPPHCLPSPAPQLQASVGLGQPSSVPPSTVAPPFPTENRAGSPWSDKAGGCGAVGAGMHILLKYAYKRQAYAYIHLYSCIDIYTCTDIPTHKYMFIHIFVYVPIT